MRWTTVLAAGSVVCAVLTAAPAAGAVGEGGQVVTGVVRRAVVDGGRGDVQVTVVQSATAAVQVPTSALAGVRTGRTVTVHLGAAVAPGDGGPTARAESGRSVRSVRVHRTTLGAPATDTSPRAVLPVLVTPAGTSPEPGLAAGLGSAIAQVGSFYGSQTHGTITYSALPAVTAPVPAGLLAGCDLVALEQAVRAAVAAPRGTTLVLRTPGQQCDFAGVAWLGDLGERDSALWLNGTSDRFTLAHELGHTLGLQHSATSAHCAGGAADDGSAEECSTVEYGDPFDVMGGSAGGTGDASGALLGEVNAAQRDRLGGFTGAELAAVDPARSTTSTLAALGGPGGPQALRFSTAGSTYYVELRTGAGRDAGFYPRGWYYGTPPVGAGEVQVPAGLTVRRTDERDGRSRLLEPRAGGPAFTLPAGATFTTSDGAVTVTASVVGTASAVVRVGPATTPQTQQTPQAPPVVAGVPGVPVLTGLRPGPASATFTIAPAAAADGVRGYLLTPYRAGIAQEARAVTPASGGVVTVTGLSAGSSYRFGVRAVGAAGPGPEALTEAVVPAPATVTVPRRARGRR